MTEQAEPTLSELAAQYAARNEDVANYEQVVSNYEKSLERAREQRREVTNKLKAILAAQQQYDAAFANGRPAQLKDLCDWAQSDLPETWNYARACYLYGLRLELARSTNVPDLLRSELRQLRKVNEELKNENANLRVGLTAAEKERDAYHAEIVRRVANINDLERRLLAARELVDLYRKAFDTSAPGEEPRR